MILTRRKSVIGHSLAVALIGIFCLGQPINRLIEHSIHSILRLPTYSVLPITTWLLPVVGIGLIFSSFYLLRQKRTAYLASLIGLICLIIIGLIVRRYFISTIIISGAVVWLISARRLYVVKSDLVSIRQGLAICSLLLIIALVYGIVGFQLLGMSGFGRLVNFSDAVVYTTETLINSAPINATSRAGDLFIESLNLVGITTLLFALASLFKPVRFALHNPSNDRATARSILEVNSLSSEDYFKLWPHGKHYYFSSDRTTFLAYGLSRNTVIVLGDPSGDLGQFEQLVSSFVEFTQANGWALASINATDVSGCIYQKYGLNKLFIGNEAIIQTQHFVNQATKSKHFRYVKNRARKEGLKTEYWSNPSRAQIAQLKPLSDTWLERSGRREYSFFMGYFDHDYLKAGTMMVLKQKERIVAYINIIPGFTNQAASIDHMRYVDGLPTIAMHYLLMELIIRAQKNGMSTVNLGLAPLSGLEKKLKRTPPEKILSLIKLWGNSYYSFKGVEQFKNKFCPDWQPRFLYYQANLASLPLLVRDIERLARYPRTYRWFTSYLAPRRK